MTINDAAHSANPVNGRHRCSSGRFHRTFVSLPAAAMPTKAIDDARQRLGSLGSSVGVSRRTNRNAFRA
jgi:hypothetical protein